MPVYTGDKFGFGKSPDTGGGPAKPGEAVFVEPGQYDWVCPDGVTSVCAVCVGGGGGSTRDEMGGSGGGGLGYKNNIAVTPGETYKIQVGAGGVGDVYMNRYGCSGGDSWFINATTVKGGGGGGTGCAADGDHSVPGYGGRGGTYVGDGGGNGGNGGDGNRSSISGTGTDTGGGGAGGYSGDGGQGGDYNGGNWNNGTHGNGGGGGGGCTGAGGSNEYWGGGGGGVSIYGKGRNGETGENHNHDWQSGGVGGSGGAAGWGNGGYASGYAQVNGGQFGGGGGSTDQRGGHGASGAVRILWGAGREFPSTAVDDFWSENITRYSASSAVTGITSTSSNWFRGGLGEEDNNNYGSNYNYNGIVPNIESHDPLNGDLTVECWIYLERLADNTQSFGDGTDGWGACIMDGRGTGNSGGSYLGSWYVSRGNSRRGSTGPYFLNYGATNSPSSTMTSDTECIQQCTWHHVAITRQNNVWWMWVDGVKVKASGSPGSGGEGATAQTLTAQSDRPVIGAWGYGGRMPFWSWYGNISNFRISKDLALYDGSNSTYTVPTFPLTTSIPGSGGGGTTYYKVAQNSTSGHGSYIDLGADLITPNYQTYTVEVWCRPLQTPSGEVWVVDQHPSGSGRTIIGAGGGGDLGWFSGGWFNTSTSFGNTTDWAHLAFVANNGNIEIFKNGISVGSQSGHITAAPPSQNTIWGQDTSYGSCGCEYRGFRINSNALYTSNFTPPSIDGGLTNIAGTLALWDGLTGSATDASGNNTWSAINMTFTSLGSSGGSSHSLNFNGTNHLSVGASSDMSMGTGDFTIECWARFDTGANVGLWQVEGLTTNYTTTLSFAHNGSNWHGYRGGSTWDYGGGRNASQWYHCAYVRHSGTCTIYVDGSSLGSWSDSYNYQGTTLVIGGYYTTGYRLNGNISNFRVVKGQALYTSNFTPSTSPLTTTSQGATASNVKLLCANKSSATGKDVGPSISNNGGVVSQTSHPFGATGPSVQVLTCGVDDDYEKDLTGSRVWSGPNCMPSVLGPGEPTAESANKGLRYWGRHRGLGGGTKTGQNGDPGDGGLLSTWKKPTGSFQTEQFGTHGGWSAQASTADGVAIKVNPSGAYLTGDNVGAKWNLKSISYGVPTYRPRNSSFGNGPFIPNVHIKVMAGKHTADTVIYDSGAFKLRIPSYNDWSSNNGTPSKERYTSCAFEIELPNGGANDLDMDTWYSVYIKGLAHPNNNDWNSTNGTPGANKQNFWYPESTVSYSSNSSSYNEMRYAPSMWGDSNEVTIRLEQATFNDTSWANSNHGSFNPLGQYPFFGISMPINFMKDPIPSGGGGAGTKGTQSDPAINAKEMYDLGQRTNGYYWIKGNGAASNARQIYCIMDDTWGSGGGWMVIANHDAQKQPNQGHQPRPTADSAHQGSDDGTGASYTVGPAQMIPEKSFSVNMQDIPFTKVMQFVYSQDGGHMAQSVNWLTNDPHCYWCSSFNSEQTIPTGWSAWILVFNNTGLTLDWNGSTVSKRHLYSNTDPSCEAFGCMNSSGGSPVARNGSGGNQSNPVYIATWAHVSDTNNYETISWCDTSTDGYDDWQDGSGQSDDWYVEGTGGKGSARGKPSMIVVQ